MDEYIYGRKKYPEKEDLENGSAWFVAFRNVTKP
jgi:hypothetical protein